MKVAIVAPCHIPPTKDWIYSLDREARVAEADVIIVDDSDGKLGEMPKTFNVYDYGRQKTHLQENYEEFARLFHKCAACRVFGHLVAYQAGYDVVIGLDSDCVVPFNFVQTHLAALASNKAYGWTNPLGGSGMYPRGYPYHMRNWKIVANMGMWENVLDLNGKDRQPNEPKRISAPGFAPAPAPMPFSGMNFALAREAIPGYLFLPNFKFFDDDFRRIDDIWGGYVFQRLARLRNEAVTFGAPVVYHDTIVDAAADAAEEAAMYKYEEPFMDIVDEAINNMGKVAPLTTYYDLYQDFVHNLDGLGYFDTSFLGELQPAMEWWIKVFKNV